MMYNSRIMSRQTYGVGL